MAFKATAGRDGAEGCSTSEWRGGKECGAQSRCGMVQTVSCCSRK